ncbi:class I SAM-dependent methyltransferase [Dawidia soli]|uniref:Methyltransferase domain-containing protein n=1 Tax=Dawidia soli TaxID=2782352 RepID=A0AAP2DF58_9BACT|nr:class I SAM-dependent methyltransferase [Dawidia soli]MBT1689655.1 methyltransferase domain-containing protein [Dawidia soli]
MYIINKTISVFKRFAWFKRFNARITYQVLAKYIPSADWHFMNYGYVPDAEERHSNVPPFNVKHQHQPAAMYHYLACKVPVTGKVVLEVGSGRGGGASYVANHFRPKQYIAVDIASSAVALANKFHSTASLRFVQGSGEHLLIQDDSIDIVMNVESSHGYGDVAKFLSEVKRVLRPGGHLLLVDFRNSLANMAIFSQQLLDSGMILLSKENISTKVVRAIELDDDSKTSTIKRLVPRRYQRVFSDFAGVVGSRFYNTLKDGTRPYCRFVLQKQTPS